MSKQMFPAVKERMEEEGKKASFYSGLAFVFGSLSVMCLVVLPASGLALTAAALHGVAAVMNGLTARTHYQRAKEAIRFTQMTNEENPDEEKIQESLDRLFNLDSKLSKKIKAELDSRKEVVISRSAPVNPHLDEASLPYSQSLRDKDAKIDEQVSDGSEGPPQEEKFELPTISGKVKP